MSTNHLFYGRAGIATRNTPQTTANSEAFEQNTFVRMEGFGQVIPFAAADTSVPLSSVVDNTRNCVTTADGVTLNQSGWYMVQIFMTPVGPITATRLRIAYSVSDVRSSSISSASAVTSEAVELLRFTSLTAGQTIQVWAQAETADQTCSLGMTLVYLGPN